MSSSTTIITAAPTATLWFEILNTLATSLPFWLAVIAIFFLWMFHESIDHFLRNIQSAKVGKDGIDLSTSQAVIAVNTTPPDEAEVPDKKYEEEKKEQAQDDTEPRTYDEWRMEMIIAALMKDKDKAENAYQKMLELRPDTLSKKRSEITYWTWKHTLGETTAISKLKIFADEADVALEANMALGFCYSNSEDFATAVSYYSIAVKLATVEKEKVHATERYASSLYSNGQKSESIKVLEDALIGVKKTENRVSLFTNLADLYEKEKDYENRAIVLEKALELQPNDTSLLFKAAYSYSNSSHDELALLHYLNSKNINPDDASVRNNLGVEFDTLGMPFKSIANYRIAAEKGETLAMSNIAYRLMNAGFDNEAKLELEKAQENKEPHENVAQAISDLSKRKNNEDEREREVQSKAQILRKFILGYADAKYIPANGLGSSSGAWTMKDLKGNNITVTISTKENEISLSWKELVAWSNSSTWDYSATGRIHNNSGDLQLMRDKSPYGRLKVFLTKEGDQIHLMTTGDYRTKEVVVLRKT